MGEVVNLRAARKQKARDAREAEASANRVKFGLTKAEKQSQKLESAREQKAFDAHKLESE